QWLKDRNDNVVSQSVRHTITGDTLTISSVAESDQGLYWCQGEIRSRSISSIISDPVRVTLNALPKATLTVKPNPAYTGETVTLTCSTLSYRRWSYQWYKDRNDNVVSQSVRHTVTGDTLTISSVAESDQGLYWCQGEIQSRSISSIISDPVRVTLNDGDVILESPVHPVTEGDSVTLSCRNRKVSSNFKADFYKDGVLIKNETTGEMTIPTVSKSDEGFYKCKSGQGESPESWVTVRGQKSISLPRLLCGLLVMSPFLLVSIVLTVKCCRARGLCSTVKSPQDQIRCDDVVEQNESSV
ncbi:hypothetical protein J4Q44_G00376850, partial [Coregonus suidteri]